MAAAANDPGERGGSRAARWLLAPPPAASNSRRASRAPHLVGRRCACRSRSPARSPRSPCYPDSLLEVDGELGGVEDAAQVEQEAAVVDAAEDGRARGAEVRGDALGAHLRVLDRERAARGRHGGGGPAPRPPPRPGGGGAASP